MRCPNCDGQAIKYGFKHTKDGKIQRYRCKACSHIFTPHRYEDLPESERAVLMAADTLQDELRDFVEQRTNEFSRNWNCPLSVSFPSIIPLHGDPEEKQAKVMTLEKAQHILESYTDTRGYDLAITQDEYDDLWLYDGIVREEITEDTEKDLKTRIEAWINTAEKLTDEEVNE